MQAQMNTDRRAMEFALDRCRELEQGLAFQFQDNQKLQAALEDAKRQNRALMHRLERIGNFANTPPEADDPKNCTSTCSPGPHPMEVTGHDCTDKPDRAMPRQPADRIVNSEMLELAWGLLCNVDAGNWIRQSPDWRQAAERWKERYHRAKGEL